MINRCLTINFLYINLPNKLAFRIIIIKNSPVQTDPNAENVIRQPSPFVDDVFHTNANRCQNSAQFRDATRSIAQRRVEFD